LAACRRLLLEITVYLAMHPHRVYDEFVIKLPHERRAERGARKM
jgi:hypothetical protein